jgi:cytochrome c2
MVNLSEVEKNMVLRSAPKDRQKGRVEFEVCAVCGKVEWGCTRSDRPDEVVITQMYAPCQRCHEVRARAPELVDWILATLAWRMRCEKEPRAE